MCNTRFRTFLLLCGVVLLALGGLRIGIAQHHTGTETTFVGRVVGLACYLGHGTVGDSHRECALTCAKKGIPMAILDQSTMKPLPPTHPVLQKAHAIWDELPYEKQKALHRVWVKNSRAPADMQVIKEYQEKLEEQ